MKDELKYLEEVFIQNGYPQSLTQCIFRKRKHVRNDAEQQQESPKNLCLPYVKEVVNEFRGCINKLRSG